MKIITLFFFLIVSVYANDLKNNQSIILASLSSFSNAQNFIKDRLQNNTEPVFILKSDRGFFIVTLGIYSTKKEVYNAQAKLSKEMRALDPFRGNFDYNLTQSNEAILYTTFKKSSPVMTKNNIFTIPNDTVKKKLTQKKNHSIDSIALAIGKTANDKNLQRISIQKNFKEKFSLTDNLQFDGYFDFSTTRFDFGQKNIYNFSITPVFQYNLIQRKNFGTYLFAGVGVSLFSDTMADTKNLSTYFQFDDRIGIGLKKEMIDFQLAYFHNSNGSIKEPNDGIDMILLNIMYKY